ncbi:MAG: zinc-dependent metalloprotease [Fimbriimonadaceae bacterium]|nr:zinc-dependent metalloprotease [Fimbriimonadaceae bacterium]
MSFPTRGLVPLIVAVLMPAVWAQTSPPTEPPPQREAPKEQRQTSKPGEPKPYKEVVTAEAKTQTGLFAVHRIGDKVLFEIPKQALGAEMLWTTEIAESPLGGFGGTQLGDNVVRWTRRENKIFLRKVSHSIRAADDAAIKIAVAAASVEPIIAAFDVEAEGEGGSAVIDVTKFFTSDPQDFSAKRAVNGGNVDASRSYIDSVKAFPTNIETRSLLTFNAAPPAAPSPFGGRGAGGARNTASSATALVHYSMVLLPETPMHPREYDSRVGYFSVGFQEYGAPENRVMDKRYISRFRLEKKDPAAAVSEPVKPIVFYLSREVPEKWRAPMKQGIEWWNKAFETAGFRNAIVARDAPTAAEDPNWDPEDARYSVVRWAPTPTENAMGPSVQDPRSGETISAHIIVWHNVLNLAQMWYFVQASPNDPSAQRLPLPDELTGRLIEYVVAHEVGHTLGLQHNFRGSSTYSIAQLRDPKFTEQYGTEASVMDYGRFNYVAQPGDGARLIPTLGPYDLFAIEWGYKPILGNASQEKTELDKIAARQVTNPMLRFGGGMREDPTQQSEDLGDDALEATRLGLLNLERVMKYLVAATTKPGEDYSFLQEVYQRVLGQRSMELNHVTRLVGGVVETNWHAGRGGDVFVPVPKARQAAAIAFLNEHAFATPEPFLDPGVLLKIDPAGWTEQVVGTQRGLLASLLSDDRINRMTDNVAMIGDRAYPITEMVADLQNGIWRELLTTAPVIDEYRRSLQRAYLEIYRGKLVGDAATTTELRGVAVWALKGLAATIDRALPKVKDKLTILHLQDCRRTIDRILDPNKGG